MKKAIAFTITLSLVLYVYRVCGQCIAPFDGEDIDEIDCRPPVVEPRCNPPCQMPPCNGYELSVRPEKRFEWVCHPKWVVYKIDIEHQITKEKKTIVFEPEDYMIRNNRCLSCSTINAYLPRMLSHEDGYVPVVGCYRWTLSALEDLKWIEIDDSRFSFWNLSNPLGTAVIEFRWKTKEESGYCGDGTSPTTFWIHLPIDYPMTKHGRSEYEWGYLFLQATDDLLPPEPLLSVDYSLISFILPDSEKTRNIQMRISGCEPSASSQLSLFVMYAPSDPWTPVTWDFDKDFYFEGTDMPRSMDVWPAELVESGYLDEGPMTAPFTSILEEYVWCDPYPQCSACPRSNDSGPCCYCYQGFSEDFCIPDFPGSLFDTEDRSTWKGVNALDWFRRNRLSNPDINWTIKDNLKALDRLMSRWPVFINFENTYPWMIQTSQYNTNDVIMLCDPDQGLDVLDHWRYTDSTPEIFFRTGLGCSNASTHLGLSMARMLNFPARAACMAHYHNDIELWLPYGPPANGRYALDEGEWVRFIAEDFIETDWTADPPDPAGGDVIAANLKGIFKTTNYITWNSEDSIPFNWYRSGTEPEYEPCRSILTDRQWPQKTAQLYMPDHTVKWIAVYPSKKDFSAGEGLDYLREIHPLPEYGDFLIYQHLIPLGNRRAFFVLKNKDRFDIVVVDTNLRKRNEYPLIFGEPLRIIDPGYYDIGMNAMIFDPYIILEISKYDLNWRAADEIPTPTPAPTVTPTPVPLFLNPDIDVLMPGSEFSKGDTFYVGLDIFNPSPVNSSFLLYFILQMEANYYFWPGWQLYNRSTHEGLDNLLLDLPKGLTRIMIFDPFDWPDTSGQSQVVFFHAALTDLETTRIIGHLETVEWYYH